MLGEPGMGSFESREETNTADKQVSNAAVEGMDGNEAGGKQITAAFDQSVEKFAAKKEQEGFVSELMGVFLKHGELAKEQGLEMAGAMKERGLNFMGGLKDRVVEGAQSRVENLEKRGQGFVDGVRRGDLKTIGNGAVNLALLGGTVGTANLVYGMIYRPAETIAFMDVAMKPVENYFDANPEVADALAGLSYLAMYFAFNVWAASSKSDKKKEKKQPEMVADREMEGNV